VILAAVGLVGGTLLVVLLVLVRQVRREIESRYRRLESWEAIYSVITPRIPFPPVRPWMATPELLRAVVHQIFEQRPKVVLELGSGLSTVVCAYAAERVGARVVSLDHEERFAEQTRRLLAHHGLSEVATVLHAPLVDTEVNRVRVPWYSLDALDELDPDPAGVLLIDGPPGADRKLARYPAVPRLWPRLTDDAVVVLDDARRADEQEIVRRWTREHAALTFEYIATEKGTAILRRE